MHPPNETETLNGQDAPRSSGCLGVPVGVVGCLSVMVIGLMLLLLVASPYLRFMYVDYYSIPLSYAPEDVQQTLQREVDKYPGESVILLNFDSVDYQHINVLTNQRVFHLSFIDDGIDYEIPLDQICSVHVDKRDPRFLIIQGKDGEDYKMFFVGSVRGFRNAVSDRLNADE